MILTQRSARNTRHFPQELREACSLFALTIQAWLKRRSKAGNGEVPRLGRDGFLGLDTVGS